MVSYEEARADFEFLERVAMLEDQVELDADRLNLMRNPTKAQAAKMYQSGIALWFHEHRDLDGPDLQRIAEKYGVFP